MIQRHKVFGDRYLSNGRNGTEAYKKTYPRCKTSHRQNAAVLLARPDMVAYLAGREKELAAAAGFTVEKCLKKYLHQHDLASAAGQHSAAVQAITGAARLFGFDKVVKVLEDKITPLSDKDRENFENAARDMNVKLAAG